MNTNRANAFSPEAIAQREAEGMTICDNCLTERYSYETHPCPGPLEYANVYSAAPEIESWHEVTLDELAEFANELFAMRSSAAKAGPDQLRQHEQESDEAEWALRQMDAGRRVFVARDEDGFYFAARV